MDAPRAGTPVTLAPEVRRALDERRPVVALESSVLSQGLPIPANREAATRMTAAVDGIGGVPAFVGVVSGTPRLGLTREDLDRFLRRDGVWKASARDLPVAMAFGRDASTTVSASLVICRAAGLSVFATGGIGGVHHEPPFDESADLLELSRTPAIVVCAGAKSVLDLAATLERLESLSVTVVGYRTNEFPGFFFASSGLPLPAVANSVTDIARIFEQHRRLGLQGAVLVVRPPPAEYALPRSVVDDAVSRALEEARALAIRGAAVTPFLLAAVDRATDGASLRANLGLLESNARLAGEVARALLETREA